MNEIPEEAKKLVRAVLTAAPKRGVELGLFCKEFLNSVHQPFMFKRYGYANLHDALISMDDVAVLQKSDSARGGYFIKVVFSEDVLLPHFLKYKAGVIKKTPSNNNANQDGNSNNLTGKACEASESNGNMTVGRDIYIGNFPLNFTECDLKKLLNGYRYDDLRKISKDGKNFAFVRMYETSDIDNVLQELNGLMIKGKTLKVNMRGQRQATESNADAIMFEPQKNRQPSPLENRGPPPLENRGPPPLEKLHIAPKDIRSQERNFSTQFNDQQRIGLSTKGRGFMDAAYNQDSSSGQSCSQKISCYPPCGSNRLTNAQHNVTHYLGSLPQPPTYEISQENMSLPDAQFGDSLNQNPSCHQPVHKAVNRGLLTTGSQGYVPYYEDKMPSHAYPPKVVANAQLDHFHDFQCQDSVPSEQITRKALLRSNRPYIPMDVQDPIPNQASCNTKRKTLLPTPQGSQVLSDDVFVDEQYQNSVLDNHGSSGSLLANLQISDRPPDAEIRGGFYERPASHQSSHGHRKKMLPRAPHESNIWANGQDPSSIPNHSIGKTMLASPHGSHGSSLLHHAHLRDADSQNLSSLARYGNSKSHQGYSCTPSNPSGQLFYNEACPKRVLRKLGKQGTPPSHSAAIAVYNKYSNVPDNNAFAANDDLHEISIANFPYHMTKSEIRDLVQDFSPMKIIIGNNQFLSHREDNVTYAYIRFLNYADAYLCVEALDTLVLGDNVLYAFLSNDGEDGDSYVGY